MSEFRSFLKGTGLFVIGNVLSRSIAFLMLPLYTAFIAPEGMGYYDLSVMYVMVAGEALFLNIWVVVLRHMFDFEGDRKSRAIAAGLVIFGASTAIYGTLAVVVALLTDLPYFWLIVLYGIVLNVEYLYKHVARGYRRNADFAISGVLAALIIAGMNVLLLVGYGWDFSALYVASIIAFAAEVVYLEIRVGLLRRLGRADFRELTVAYLRRMAVFALPIGLNAVVYWLVNSVNRIVISTEMSLVENGIFATSMKFGALVVLVMTAITYAWQDVAFRRTAADAEFFSRVASLYYAVLMVALAVLLPIVAVLFPWLVNVQYAASFVLIPLTLWVAVQSGYSSFLVNVFYSLKRSRVTFIAMAIAALVNVALVYPLVLLFGLHGANLAPGLSFTAAVIYMHAVLGRSIGFRFDYRQALLAMLPPAASFAVFYLGSQLVNFVYGFALVVVIAAVVWFKFRDRLSALLGRRRPAPGADTADAGDGPEADSGA